MAGLRSVLEKHVTFEEENDYWKCNYCPQKSCGRPNRIKAHLTGKKNQGIKICPGLTSEVMEKIDREVKTVEQQLQQQRGEKDDTRQKKGNKKRKFASGSGTIGSDPAEAVMPLAPPGSSNSSFAFCDSNAVSEEHSQRLERSVGEAEPDNYSPFPNSDVIYSLSENWHESFMFSAEYCTPPSDEGRSYVPVADNPGVGESNALGMLENNSGGVEETNDVGSEPNNTMHGGQSSLLDCTQVPSLHGQGGMEMDLGDQRPPPPLGNCDCMNNQRMHPPQCGVGTDAPPLGNVWFGSMIFSPENCTPPSDEGRSSNPRVEESNALAMRENNSDGVVETNDVGSEPNNIMHEGQSSGVDSTQVPSPHGRGGMEMDLGDQIPPPSQGNSDYSYRRPMAFWRCLAGIGAEPVFTNPPCPPGFDSDLWDFYLKIDACSSFALYEVCTSLSVGDMNHELACLASACYAARTSYSTEKHLDSDPDFGTARLYAKFFAESRMDLSAVLRRLTDAEKLLRNFREQKASVVGTKRKMEMNRWLAYASYFKKDVGLLDMEAKNAKSPSEILELVKRLFGLKKAATELCEMGNALLNPIPEDLLIWNHSFMGCGSRSQMEYQRQCPPEVSNGH